MSQVYSWNEALDSIGYEYQKIQMVMNELDTWELFIRTAEKEGLPPFRMNVASDPGCFVCVDGPQDAGKAGFALQPEDDKIVAFNAVGVDLPGSQNTWAASAEEMVTWLKTFDLQPAKIEKPSSGQIELSFTQLQFISPYILEELCKLRLAPAFVVQMNDVGEITITEDLVKTHIWDWIAFEWIEIQNMT